MYKKLFIFLILFPFTLLASGNGMTSSGMDDYLNDQGQVPWFVNQNKFGVCLEVDKGSVFKESVYLEMVKRSLLKWNNFILSNNIKNRHLSFELNLKCVGKEDLKIIIAVKNEMVKKVLDYEFDHTYAFSKLIKKPSRIHNGKGIIWINNPLDTKSIFGLNPLMVEVSILHEIGHVFGFGHLKNTVMDPKFVSSFFQDFSFEIAVSDGPLILNSDIYFRLRNELFPIDSNDNQERDLNLNRETMLVLEDNLNLPIENIKGQIPQKMYDLLLIESYANMIDQGHGLNIKLLKDFPLFLNAK